MSALEGITIDVSVVIGSTQIPIRQILKMSRGALIPLDVGQDDPSLVYANDTLVARGRVLVTGEQIALEITDVVKRPR